MRGIPIYDDINDLHALTGSTLRTKNPLFHCFDMALANNLVIDETGPHRAAFYTLALNFGTQKLTYTLNGQTFNEPDNFLLCVSPGQIVHWKKKGNWQGYCCFFKQDFLNIPSNLHFLRQYPFFNFDETNVLPVDDKVFKRLEYYFKEITREQDADVDFSRHIIQSCLQAVLWIVRQIYEKNKRPLAGRGVASYLTAQFKYLVNERFLQATKVEDYAAMLNVSANHLSQTIAEAAGKTAKSVINERRVAEAKYLLAYTNNSLQEIADHLSFTDQAHFSKLFKSSTGVSPTQYRQKTATT